MVFIPLFLSTGGVWSIWIDAWWYVHVVSPYFPPQKVRDSVRYMQKALMALSCLFRHRMSVISQIDLVPIGVDPSADSLTSFVHPDSWSFYSTPPGLSAHSLFPSVCTQRVRYLLPLKTLISLCHLFPDRAVSPHLVTRFASLSLLCIDNLWDQDISMDKSLPMARWKHKTSLLYLSRDYPLNPGGRHWWNVISWNYDISGMLGCSQVLEISRIVLQRLIVYIFAHNVFASDKKTYILYLLVLFCVL